MKTYTNLYERICSKENLLLAYKKARKGKSKCLSVIAFEKNPSGEINKLHDELIAFTYRPKPLRRFIIKDPKTRVIHASAFRDRIVHHALINVIGLIFEKRFIFDSYASRVGKGTHSALQRFDFFKRKVSCNGKLIYDRANANFVRGYILKADIKHYFDTVDHEVLINILKKKIKDGKIIWLVRKILENFEFTAKSKGMPLGNYTSQFFANVYLNELDYFIKNVLRAKYYLRYVDDFVILHKRKNALEYYRFRIIQYLKCLKLELHKDKSRTIPLCKGVEFVGYKIFYLYRRVRKRNLRKFKNSFGKRLILYKNGEITKNFFIESLQGWLSYARWADTFKLERQIIKKLS